MLRRINNHLSVILSDVSKLTSALPTVGTVVTDSNLEKGAVVMTDAGMRRTTLSALADGDGFFIVQGKGIGVKLMRTPLLNKGKIRLTTSKHKEVKQQITTIGYNGTTGSLPVANNTKFYLKIRKNDNDAANRSQPESLFIGPVKTDASGTQQELAFALMSNGLKNFAQEPANGYLKIEVISDGTAAVVSDGTQTQDAIVVKGSKVITLVDTGTTTAGNTAGIASAIPAGSTIYIAGATYLVESLSANAVTLTTPYQGASATITGGTTVATQFGEVTAVTNYGIRLTGVQANFDVNKFRDFYANRFTATFSDESTLVTHIQGAYNGSGMWQQVAMDEYLAYGIEGQNDMLGMPPSYRDQEVKIPGVGSNTALTSKYSTINAYWEEVNQTALVSVVPAKGNVLIYLNLLDSSGTGLLDTATANTGETLAAALGLTPANLDE